MLQLSQEPSDGTGQSFSILILVPPTLKALGVENPCGQAKAEVVTLVLTQEM
ncbi:MAG: hypothetical protein AAF135_23295 [Bacteroidota bacterium]